jgi:hypothetical protein
MHRRGTSGKDDQEHMDDRTGSSDPQPPQLVTFDAILPPAMALRAEETDVKRINTDPMTRFFAIASTLIGPPARIA